jgi:hypothetical protein
METFLSKITMNLRKKSLRINGPIPGAAQGKVLVAQVCQPVLARS